MNLVLGLKCSASWSSLFMVFIGLFGRFKVLMAMSLDQIHNEEPKMTILTPVI